MTGGRAPGRRATGKTAHHAGLAAEELVARHYATRGRRVVAMRWRGTAGEIDLIIREGDTLVFVEVKKARDPTRAAERLSPAQMRRIYAAASEYLAGTPDGQASEARFDVALVDSMGRLTIIENAFCG